MSRVRWGNVAQLAALAVAVALIAFGTPAGCGSEPEVIPLDALPGEPFETAAPMPAPHPRHPRRVRERRAVPRPPRARRRRAPRPRPAAPPVSVAGRRLPPRAPIAPLVPEAAREFSFDR